MGLRDRLNRPAATAIPAILRFSEDQGAAHPAKIAKIATIASLDDPFAGIPTIGDEAEIRALLRLLLRHESPGDHPDFPEALALALADPVAHLECFRASARAEGLL